jgi:hypothetical protein
MKKSDSKKFTPATGAEVPQKKFFLLGWLFWMLAIVSFAGTRELPQAQEVGCVAPNVILV